MNIVYRLTLRQLRLNRGRTIMTILGIVLSIAMVCCVAGFVFSLRDLGIESVKQRVGDWHVAYINVSAETASSIAEEELFSSYYVTEGDTEGQSNIYLRLENPGRDIIDLAGGIAEKYGVETWGGNTELLAFEGIIPYDNIMVTFLIIATIAIAVIVAGSVIVIANAFFISSSERVRQFGILKSAGATSSQLRFSILFEALVLMLIAAPLGILLGFAIQAAVLWTTNSLLAEVFALNIHDATLAFRVVFSPMIILVSVAIALLTVLISAWLPARRAARTSPIDAIRQTKDIRVKPGSTKSSRLTKALFGFEGTLAARSLKRSRGKYRSTVVSLSMSIILFVSMSSIIWVLNKSVDMQYGGYDFDVLIDARGDLDTLGRIEKELSVLPDAEVQTTKRINLQTTAPDGFLSESVSRDMAREIAEGNEFGILLFSVPDKEFSRLLPITGSSVSAILVNTATYTHNNRKVELSPFNCEVGTVLPLKVKSSLEEQHDPDTVNPSEGIREESLELGSISIGKVINEIPEGLSEGQFMSSSLNAASLLVPESFFREFFSAHENELLPRTGAWFTATTLYPDTFSEEARTVLGPFIEDDAAQVFVTNISQMTRFNQNISMLFMLFGYGFITMLSLIAITSVVATISTNMALRRQEFAMLYSVGMTPRGMDRMLNLESLLYGLKSLAIGLPISLILSFVIFKAMENTFAFAYQPPLVPMLICVVAVLLLTFGTMRYSKGKLRRTSIVEAIRDEVV